MKKFCYSRVLSFLNKYPSRVYQNHAVNEFLINTLRDYFWTVILSNAGEIIFGNLAESPFSCSFDNILLYMAGALLGRERKETNCGKLWVSVDSF